MYVFGQSYRSYCTVDFVPLTFCILPKLDRFGSFGAYFIHWAEFPNIPWCFSQVWGLHGVTRQTGRHPSSGEETAVSLHGSRWRGAVHPGGHLGCWPCLWSPCGRNLVPKGPLLDLRHICHHAWLQSASQSSSDPLRPVTWATSSHPGPWNTYLHPCTEWYVDLYVHVCRVSYHMFY